MYTAGSQSAVVSCNDVTVHMWLMGCPCVMSSVCMGRWCSLRVQGLCVTLSRKIHSATGVMSMFTSSKVRLVTSVLDTMQQPIL